MSKTKKTNSCNTAKTDCCREVKTSRAKSRVTGSKRKVNVEVPVKLSLWDRIVNFFKGNA